MDFEERISRALNEAGHSYDLDAPPLLDRGLRRGYALRRRRRVAFQVTGAALALAVIGTGAAALSPTPMFGRTGPTTTTSTPTATDGSPVSGQQILDLLEGALPSGQVSQARAVGAGGGRPAFEIPSAQFLYDDGHGPALFQFGSATVGNKDVLAPDGCPSPGTKNSTCQQSRLPNGSTVTFAQHNYDKKTGPAASLQWTATLVTPKGDRVWIDEFNSPTGSFTGGTRARPPLNSAQLTALVKDPDWSGLFAAIRTSKPDGQPSAAQVIATARKLMPTGSVYQSIGSSQESFASFFLDKQSFTFDFTVERWPAEARDEVVADQFSGATTLPDGTLLRVQPAGSPTTMTTKQAWQVRALLPDGTSVLVAESYLGLRPNPSPSVVPLLSVAQLKAIVQSPEWTE